MIECKICGFSTKSTLSRHIPIKHKMSLKEYFEKYGEYKTEEYKKKCRDSVITSWENGIFKNRKNFYTEEFKNKISNTLKKGYEEGRIKVWNEGKTKDIDTRLKSIGEKNSIRYKGTKNPKHSEWMKRNYLINNKLKNWRLDKTFEEMEIINNEISETIIKRHKEGVYQSKKYKNGYFLKENGEAEFYQSSWELDIMVFMEINKIKWTKKHNIIIKLPFGCDKRNYLPDFLIEDFFIVELKGYDHDGLTEIKKNEAIKIYGDRYKIFYSIEEMKEFLNERINDKKNNKSL